MDTKDINKVLVVGAGVMGHSIAQVFAGAGFSVSLVDVDQEVLDRALGLIESNLNTLVEYGNISGNEVSPILSRISPSTDLSGMV